MVARHPAPAYSALRSQPGSQFMFFMRSIKPICLRLAMILISLGLVFVLLEAILRLTQAIRHDPSDSFDDRSRVTYYPQDSRLHPWSIGSSNVLRIAIIGDSITIGHGVQIDDTYGFRLERLLNLNDGVPPAEVRLYARGGLSTFMEVFFLKKALKEKPHIVLLGLCYNDMEDFLRKEELDRWREEMMPRVPGPWLGAVLRGSPAPRIAALRRAAAFRSGSCPRRATRLREIRRPFRRRSGGRRPSRRAGVWSGAGGGGRSSR